MKKVPTIVIVLLLYVCGLQAQEYFTGCLIDTAAYNAIPQKAPLLTRDYTILPSSYSLMQYCPTPRSQGSYGTCTGWASAYAARSIAEAVANDWKNKEKIGQETFSPLFVYAKIKDINDNCQSGSYIHKALEVMKNEGAVKYRSFNVDCAFSVPYSLREEAQKYKIDDYFTLFYDNSSYPQKINATKKAISQNRPVVISMKCYKSFNDATDIWSGLTDYQRGHHAMCVIGYDDNKNGGSFQIMNSWGNKWGKDGFTWVTYLDYYKNVREAYEIYVRKKVMPPVPKPAPKPEPPVKIVETYNLKGEIHFKLETENKEEMPPVLYSRNQIYYYKITENYISGTNFRIYISNNEPAYVYVIGSDLQNSVTLVFPQNDKISPALNYRSNNMALPNEGQRPFRMDNTVGTDYVCVLYSVKPLPIHDIEKKIKDFSGSFYDKVKFALSTDMISAKEINYSQNVIRFDAKGVEKTVVPVIVEITHNFNF